MPDRVCPWAWCGTNDPSQDLCDKCKLAEERDRARVLARNLFAMVPRWVWLDSGGDDGQGHYEGEYRAEQIQQEIAGWEEH